MTTCHDFSSQVRFQGRDLINSHDKVILAWIVELRDMSWSLARLAFVEDEFSDFGEVHKQRRFIIELVLEVVSEPRAIAHDNIEVNA